MVSYIHTVDLANDPPIRINNTKVVEHKGKGVVHVERRGDNLFIDDRKVELFVANQQKNDAVSGSELREVLANKTVLNANVLDYLEKHPELIPDNLER